MTYAQGTSVPVTRSRVAIEALLIKAKATSIAVGFEPGRAIVAFAIAGWHVRFKMPLPTEAEAKLLKDRRGWLVGDTSRRKWIEQTERERWRALVLAIKSKLVSVDTGVETFEEAFLAHLVVPGGSTVGQKALPAIREAYKTGTLPTLMLTDGAR